MKSSAYKKKMFSNMKDWSIQSLFFKQWKHSEAFKLWKLLNLCEGKIQAFNLKLSEEGLLRYILCKKKILEIRLRIVLN